MDVDIVPLWLALTPSNESLDVTPIDWLKNPKNFVDLLQEKPRIFDVRIVSRKEFIGLLVVPGHIATSFALCTL